MGVTENTEQSIFLGALELKTTAERMAYLKGACGENRALRAQVQALLDVHEGEDDFLQRPALAVTDAHRPITEAVGTQIGPYKLRQQIGEGGFGVVYMAEQERPVRRMVALKIIKPGMDTDQVIARFESERQALAIMDHPNIAKVFDAGATDSGHPYFVMELVKGVPITEFCDKNHMPAEKRLELFVIVCHAIQHAHHKGVIHRDVKPSNVMVTLHDGVPVVKVIDFGVAKATVQKRTERTLFTAYGQMIGTPAYMSPEQAEMSGLDIDTRSDIYSLGVLLYELLTGTTPLESKRLREAGYAEMQRLIREEEPPRPSNRLSSLGDSATVFAGNRGTDPKQLARLLAGDLDWIVMKALEKDRNRRYGTPGNFAEDVERYLKREAILARPPSASYKLRKFAQRNRAAVVTSGMILFALLFGILGTTFGLVRAERRRVEAEQARADETEQRKIAEAEKQKAEQAEADTLADYRASTDDAIEQLIGSKPELGLQEKTYLENTLKRWQVFAARKGDDERSRAIRAEGHFRVATLWHKLGRLEEAGTEYELARGIRKNLAEQSPSVAAYQGSLAVTYTCHGALLNELGEQDEARAEYERALDLQTKLVEQFPATHEFQRDLALTHGNLGKLFHDIGQQGDARVECERARALLMELVAQFPATSEFQVELSRMYGLLGLLLTDLGQLEEGRAQFELARDIQEKLSQQFPTAPEYQRALAYTYSYIGVQLAKLGQQEDARIKWEQARDIRTRLAEQFPSVFDYQQTLAETHYNLGHLLNGLGKLNEARFEYERVLQLEEKLAKQAPAVPVYRERLAATFNTHGTLLEGLGKQDEALADYHRARVLQELLVEQFPSMPEYQKALAYTHNNLGILLEGLGKLGEARAEKEQALELKKKLVEQFPTVPDYQRDLADSYNNHGALLKQLLKHDEALAEYERALDLQKKLVDQFPAVPEYQQRLAMTHDNMGTLFAGSDQRDEARVEYEQARDMREKLAERFPQAPEYQRAFANSHYNLAYVLTDLGERHEARTEYEKARDMRQKLAEQFPTIPKDQKDLGDTHYNLGVLLAKLGQRDDARTEYEHARDIQKKLVEQFPAVPDYQISLGATYCNCGNLYNETGKPADSLEWFDNAIQILTQVHEQEPRNVTVKLFLGGSHHNRAMANDRLKKYADAVSDWDMAIELSPMPERPSLQCYRATSRLRAGEGIEALAEVEDLSTQTNSTALQWYDFACVYAVASGKLTDNKQEFGDRAMELLQQAVRAGWKDTAHMSQDSDLDPLRDREDCKKLVTELESSSAKRE